MQNNEGWLTNLSPGVVSQSKITLANHLHHKEKRRLFKTLAYILRIEVDVDQEFDRKFRKAWHCSYSCERQDDGVVGRSV
jgi:hypothetical protein